MKNAWPANNRSPGNCVGKLPGNGEFFYDEVSGNQLKTGSLVRVATGVPFLFIKMAETIPS
jgi:hypothetical protein